MKRLIENLPIRKYITVFAFGIILLSSFINVINQLFTIVKAKDENYALLQKVIMLQNDKVALEGKIKTATSSAFTEGQKRELLGMGTTNDYWIIEPKIVNTEELYPKITVGDEKSNFDKWIELFTD